MSLLLQGKNDEILSIADKKVKSGLLPMLLKVQDSLKFKTMKIKSKVDRSTVCFSPPNIKV